jgi:tetratricopeptide (TPR) repeat protein
LLAFVDIVTGENLDEAVGLLKRALELSPGRQELSMQLAQVYLRQKKFDLARETLAPLSSSNDRQLAKQSEILLDSIKRLEQQVEYVSRSNANAPGSSIMRTLTEDEAHEKTESDYLQDTLRILQAGEQRIQGVFTKLECDNNGVAFFFIQSGNQSFKIRAMALGKVHFTAYVPAGREMTCGVRRQPEDVVMTFRPATDAKDLKARIDGDAVAMELVPKDFRLKN